MHVFELQIELSIYDPLALFIFSPMVLPPGLIQTQAKSNRVQPLASLMPSQNNIWNSSYDAAGPSNYFQQVQHNGLT